MSIHKEMDTLVEIYSYDFSNSSELNVTVKEDGALIAYHI